MLSKKSLIKWFSERCYDIDIVFNYAERLGRTTKKVVTILIKGRKLIMYINEKIWIGNTENGEMVCLEPKLANRHGLIAGATGTGKTVTLRVLAESFSDMGVPVFLADVKGDLAGMAEISY